MRKMTVLASLVIAILLIIPGAGAPAIAANCQFGRVQGFVQIKDNPLELVGTIPNRFTFSSGYFDRRYNCKHRSAAVRRVDTGTYDVWFPGLVYRGVFVSAISLDGVSASAAFVSPDIYRVVLRGPLVRNDVLERRDVAFSMSVF